MDITFRSRRSAWILPIGTLVVVIPTGVALIFFDIDPLWFYYLLLGIFGMIAFLEITELRKLWIRIQGKQIILPPNFEITFPIDEKTQDISLEGLTILNREVTTFKYKNNDCFIVPIKDISAVWKKNFGKKESLYLATNICTFTLPLARLEGKALQETLHRIFPAYVFTKQAKDSSAVNKLIETRFNELLDNHQGTYLFNTVGGIRRIDNLIGGILVLVAGLTFLGIPEICLSIPFVCGGLLLIKMSYQFKREIRINENLVVVSRDGRKYAMGWDEVEKIIYDQEYYKLIGNNKILVIPNSIKDEKEKLNLSLLIFWIADKCDIETYNGQFHYPPSNKKTRVK